MPPSWRDRLLLGGLRAVPRPLARHLLFLMRSNPSLADELGFHVRPIHYYEPLPDFRTVDEPAASRRRVSPAIDFNLEGQRHLVTRLGGEYRSELAELAATGAVDFSNDYFAGFDACLYYALIRDLRPRHVIEIGAGMSTRVADHALRRNRTAGHLAELICIEPFPQPRLTDAMPSLTLIERPVETVPLEQFDVLQANDILFIDSSHAVKFGGDVCREFLEILPRLQRGVWIHVHDIFFPRDYPARWLIDQRLAFTEQYLLEAFLAFNREFEVKAANFWLAGEFAAEVKALVPESAWLTDDRGRASFWMRRA
jgi:hypothetical protein